MQKFAHARSHRRTESLSDPRAECKATTLVRGAWILICLIATARSVGMVVRSSSSASGFRFAEMLQQACPIAVVLFEGYLLRGLTERVGGFPPQGFIFDV